MALKLRKWDVVEELKTDEDMALYLEAAMEEAGDDAAKKDAAKKNGTLPYPTQDALRTEAHEEEPGIVLTVADVDGNVVRRVTAPAHVEAVRAHGREHFVRGATGERGARVVDVARGHLEERAHRHRRVRINEWSRAGERHFHAYVPTRRRERPGRAARARPAFLRDLHRIAEVLGEQQAQSIESRGLVELRDAARVHLEHRGECRAIGGPARERLAAGVRRRRSEDEQRGEQPRHAPVHGKQAHDPAATGGASAA